MKSIIFNFDCLLDFLKINRQDLLKKEFNKIIISNKVFNTISNPSIPYSIRENLNSLIKENFIQIEEINLNTSIYEIYYEIINDENNDNEILGEGEASSIALAANLNKYLAYNNPNQINNHLEKYDINYISTNEILLNLYHKEIISQEELTELKDLI